jgi:hypothetical protein
MEEVLRNETSAPCTSQVHSENRDQTPRPRHDERAHAKRRSHLELTHTISRSTAVRKPVLQRPEVALLATLTLVCMGQHVVDGRQQVGRSPKLCSACCCWGLLEPKFTLRPILQPIYILFMLRLVQHKCMLLLHLARSSRQPVRLPYQVLQLID